MTSLLTLKNSFETGYERGLFTANRGGRPYIQRGYLCIYLFIELFIDSRGLNPANQWDIHGNPTPIPTPYGKNPVDKSCVST
jgi:hypothetical protein